MLIDDFVIVYSGVPASAVRGEQGVGIAMNKAMQKAWKDTGQFCECAGSRLLRIKLRINNRIINVISVYAPTYNTEAAIKDSFYDRLNKMLGSISSCEEVFILGDFNARVKCSNTTRPEELEESVIVGPYGYVRVQKLAFYGSCLLFSPINIIAPGFITPAANGFK